jgi:tetratricopeptide (TPR) repeat protein
VKRQPILIVALVLSASVARGQSHQAGEHQLGTVHFPTSCSPAVQAEFERGVAMLHSYWFNYAGKTFRGVLDRDPSCAIGYWGIALDLLGNTLVSTPSPADARAAWDALEKARGVEAGSARERDWIETARAYFRDHETVPVRTRLQAYARALEALAARYPDDFEAQVFYALALQASAPTNDVTYASQMKSARILEGLYTQNPQHPGITHYLIHAYDFAPFADKGIPAARRYAEIAPAVPHARHMPAHIYSMVGLWEDSIRSNLSALEIQPDYYHAADFATYAYLQLAQDRQASALIAKALQTPERGDRPPTIVNYTALAAMPARYAIERADWTGAASLRLTVSPYPQADALTRFARALGKARTRDVAGATLEVEALQALRGALEKSGDSYWAARTGEQILAASGWIAHAQQRDDEAVTLMRQAADGEDGSLKNVAMENRLYPLRELLADLLLEARRPGDALTEFEKALSLTPNRYRGLYGAAVASEATGDKRRAADYYAKLVALAGNADSARPELERAREYLRK